MTNDELKNIDSEDIEELLVKVETSFGIKFVGNELIHVKTFGALCDHIANKIKLDHADDCTSQQAFYKLRDAISSSLQIDRKIISPDFQLADVFSRRGRRSRTKKLEKVLGFKLNILRPPHWLSGILTISFFGSLFGIDLDWKIGILGIISSVAGLRLANKTGNILALQTVGQVAEKMARENYLKSRRNPNSYNKTEIEKLLTNWFGESFCLDSSKLTRETLLR